MKIRLLPVTKEIRRPVARLYQEFGFRFIDEKDIHGEDIMMKKGLLH